MLYNAIAYLYWPTDKLEESVLSFDCVCPEDETQIVRLDGKSSCQSSNSIYINGINLVSLTSLIFHPLFLVRNAILHLFTQFKVSTLQTPPGNRVRTLGWTGPCSLCKFIRTPHGADAVLLTLGTCLHLWFYLSQSTVSSLEADTDHPRLGTTSSSSLAPYAKFYIWHNVLSIQLLKDGHCLHRVTS